MDDGEKWRILAIFRSLRQAAPLSPRRLVVLLDSRAAAGANLDTAKFLILETVSSCTVKNRLTPAARRHAPPRAAEPLGIPGPHQGATTQRKPDVMCIVTTRTTTKRVLWRQSSSVAGAQTNCTRLPMCAGVLMCVDVC